MRYRINYTAEARLAVRTLPGRYRQRARRMIESLAAEPRPAMAKELSELPNHFRIRLDGWRIVYRVHDDAVMVLILRIRRKSGPEIYKGLTELQ